MNHDDIKLPCLASPPSATTAIGTAKLEPDPQLEACTYAVIGAAIEVHRHLGPGFLESVYEEALVRELGARGLRVQQQLVIPVLYKGLVIAESRVDLLVDEQLVIELKAVDALLPVHTAQVVSHLKAGAFQLGLLINFNVPVLKDGVRRVTCSG